MEVSHRRDGGGVGGHQDMENVGGILEAHSRAGIKAEPSEPQDKQADDRQRHAVSRNGLGLAAPVVFPDARAEQHRPGQRRPASDRVDD